MDEDEEGPLVPNQQIVGHTSLQNKLSSEQLCDIFCPGMPLNLHRVLQFRSKMNYVLIELTSLH